MRTSRSLVLLLAVFWVSRLPGQNVNLEHPAEISVQKRRTPEEIRDRANNIQLQKDVKELADLCPSVQRDMETLKQGAFSKAAIERLQKMEKLSKHIRETLANAAAAVH